MSALQIQREYHPVWKNLGFKSLIGNPMHPRLTVYSDKNDPIKVFYAPFGYDIDLKALKKIKVLMVGVTPGMTQVKALANEFFSDEQSEDDTVSYTGSMRTNLVSMLDGIHLHKKLGLDSTSQLFEGQHINLALPTSILRYPVFYNEINYSGYQTKISSHPFLTKMVDEIFAPLLDLIPKDCLIIPMGTAVSTELQRLTANRKQLSERTLVGFPHPSSLNGTRKLTYAKNKASLKKKVLEVLT